jgi:hypothetical protein
MWFVGRSGRNGTIGSNGADGAKGRSVISPFVQDGDDGTFLPLRGRKGADGAAGGAGTQTAFTKDLGVARRSGTFDVTGLSGLTADNSYDVRQSGAKITSKGDARDEPEMDTILCTAYALDATSLRAYWFSSDKSVVVGTYAFVALT